MYHHAVLYAVPSLTPSDRSPSWFCVRGVPADLWLVPRPWPAPPACSHMPCLCPRARLCQPQGQRQPTLCRGRTLCRCKLHSTSTSGVVRTGCTSTCARTLSGASTCPGRGAIPGAAGRNPGASGSSAPTTGLQCHLVLRQARAPQRLPRLDRHQEDRAREQALPCTGHYLQRGTTEQNRLQQGTQPQTTRRIRRRTTMMTMRLAARQGLRRLDGCQRHCLWRVTCRVGERASEREV